MSTHKTGFFCLVEAILMSNDNIGIFFFFDKNYPAEEIRCVFDDIC